LVKLFYANLEVV
jgi:hypothetical protein